MGILVLHIFVMLAIVILYWYLSKRKGWFKKDHFQIPKWLSFAIGIFGIFIPATPFFIDGMLIATLLYFGNEFIFMWWKRSPLGAVVSLFTRFVRWVRSVYFWYTRPQSD